jgi:hypothetical protein
MSRAIGVMFLVAAAVGWTTDSAFATAATGTAAHALYGLFGWLPWQMLAPAGVLVVALDYVADGFRRSCCRVRC